MLYAAKGLIMCGIVGIVSGQPVEGCLFTALRRHQYRGYASAGIATVEDGAIVRRRAGGKLINLGQVLAEEPQRRGLAGQASGPRAGGLFRAGRSEPSTAADEQPHWLASALVV